MLKFLKTFSLYWNTIRYLKIQQIVFRILYRISPKIIRCSSPLSVSNQIGHLSFPASRHCYNPATSTFTFLNESHVIAHKEDWNNPDFSKLWTFNLHYFDCLRQENLTEEEGNCIIHRWIAENQFPYGEGWAPYTISLRAVNWIKWACTGHTLSNEALSSLCTQIRFLRKHLEYHLLANHLLANAKALVFAGIFFSGREAENWLQTGYTIFRHELPEQILDDGGHFELTPMYHSILYEDLLDLYHIGVDLDLKEYIRRMGCWLRFMLAPDGSIIRFNDTAQNIALSPDSLFSYAESLGISTIPEPSFIKTTGYAKLSSDPITVFADCAEIGPTYQPGHAHADNLTFELFVKETPIIAESGTGLFADSPMRLDQRSTSAHNTLVFDRESTSEIWHSHRVARRAKILSRTISHHSAVCKILTPHGITHKRTWDFNSEGDLIIEDTVSGTGIHTIDSFFHFHPDCTVSLSEGVCDIIAGNDKIQMELPANMIPEFISGIYSPEFGIFRHTVVLKLSAKHRLPTSFRTVVRVFSSNIPQVSQI